VVLMVACAEVDAARNRLPSVTGARATAGWLAVGFALACGVALNPEVVVTAKHMLPAEVPAKVSEALKVTHTCKCAVSRAK